MSDVPASLTDHLGSSGPLPVVHLNGEPKKVRFPTPKTLAKIELKIAEDALAEAEAMKKVRPGMVNEVIDKIAARYHRCLGPWWNAAFDVPLSANALLLWACISDEHPDFTLEDAIQVQKESRNEVKLALAVVTPPFLELAASKTSLTAEELAGTA